MPRRAPPTSTAGRPKSSRKSSSSITAAVGSREGGNDSRSGRGGKQLFPPRLLLLPRPFSGSLEMAPLGRAPVPRLHRGCFPPLQDSSPRLTIRVSSGGGEGFGSCAPDDIEPRQARKGAAIRYSLRVLQIHRNPSPPPDDQPVSRRSWFRRRAGPPNSVTTPRCQSPFLRSDDAP